MGMFEDMALQAGNPFVGNGVAVGVVKENWDDKHQGMVKVEYSLGEAGKNVSGWMPVMSPYGGNQFGVYLLPEVGSVALVAFLQGDRNCPVVIGTMWNKQAKLPEKTANKDNNVKLLMTKGGTVIRISEEKGKEKLELVSPGELSLTLDDEKQTITMTDKGKKNQLVLDGKKGEVTISADKKLTLKAGGKEVVTMDSSKLALKAGTVQVDASQSLKAKGQSTKLEGASVNVKASGSLKLEASGMTQVKGSMVKIN